jgi:hypothetical protein
LIAWAVESTSNFIFAALRRSGADHEPAAFPGDLFFYGQRCVSEGLAELLGRFFLAFGDCPAIYHHVVLVGDAVNADRTK